MVKEGCTCEGTQSKIKVKIGFPNIVIGEGRPPGLDLRQQLSIHAVRLNSVAVLTNEKLPIQQCYAVYVMCT